MRIGGGWLVGLWGLVSMIVDGGARAGRVEQGAACGQPGLPPCPLQSFMRNEVAAPLARGDMKTLSTSLRKVATIAPPAWASWSATALDGAAAAERGDRAALRADCNTCHQTCRGHYRQPFPNDPLP